MKRWTGAAVLALTLMFSGSAAINPADAAPLQIAAQKSQAGAATDFSAHRYHRHHRHHYYGYGYRPYYQPYYYARPYYYRSHSYYVPAYPFSFGFGFGSW